MSVVAAALAFGWGCGEGTAPPAPVATVTLSTTDPLELVAGGQQMLTAVAKDAKGNILADRITTWATSDATKVTVAAGLVTGVALGSATVSVSIEGITSSVNANVRDGTVVQPGGTSFTSGDGVLAIVVPSGAVASPVSLTVRPDLNPPANPRLLPGTAFDLGSGATFSQPLSITIKYNPATVASDSPESGLQLYELVGSSWKAIAGSTANVSNKTVTGAVAHVGTFAILMQPKVETVTVGGDLSPVAVLATRQLTATIKDNEGTTLSRAVTWSSSNPGVASVNGSGLVTAGKAPGSATITATSEGKSGTAQVSVVPGPPAKLTGFAGNNQSVAAGAAVPILPSVLITDAGDNPIANVPVTFTVTSGAGTITGGSTTTNASGIATVGSWTLGTAAGPNSLTATSSAVAGQSFVFNAAAGAGPPANIAAFSGNNQTGTAGGLIPDPPAVKVTDANGNFIAGFTVTFAPGGGSGSVSPTSVVTDATGVAKPSAWRLGTTPGTQTLIATGSGLAGSPVTFTATAVAPVPSAMAGFAGNNQTARPGRAVATPPSVIVTDPAGVPVPGVPVTFAVTSGGGSVTGASAVTGVDGIAAVGSWTLGTSLGPNSLTATGPGGIAPVVFNATAQAAPPTRIAINGGDGQSGIAGQPLPISPSVRVTDAEGVGVSGVAVTFSIRSGAGSITGANAVTDVNGIASVGSWTLGVGGNSLFGSVAGLSGDPVVFVAVGQTEVQIVTFGDSNTDLGWIGTTTQPKVASYISSANSSIRLAPSDPNDATQLAGKIESRWRSNSSKSIRAVNHASSGTGTGTDRTILTSPNALFVNNGVTRFAGEVLGDGYPWSGGEPQNQIYPNGEIFRVNAFKPRSQDWVYISTGTNDVGPGSAQLPNSVIANNLQIMIDAWIGRGLPPSHLIITTLPPRPPSDNVGAKIAGLNTLIRNLAQQKGVRLLDISVFVSADDGFTWRSSSGNPSYAGPLHLDNDLLHYSEVVRNWIADNVVSIMLATP
jgi:adhesin/invasin